MDNVDFLKEILLSLKAELIRYRIFVVAFAILIIFAILGVGLSWQNTYVSQATLEVDDTNIIQPLLRGKAEFSEVDRVEEARKSMLSKQFLEIVAEKLDYIDMDTGPEESNAILRALRAGLAISAEGKRSNYFSLSYSSGDPQVAFDSASVIVEEFVKFQQQSQRLEGEYAYDFIKKQADQYKRRLEQAEIALQDFKANGLDTTEDTVQKRIGALQTEIQELQLSIQGSESTIKETKAQLALESEYLESQSKVYSLRQQKNIYETQLAQLRMQFQESYPDVVSLKEQIAGINLRIGEVSAETGRKSPILGRIDSAESNPEILFDELRRQISVAGVELKAQNRRYASLKELLLEEQEKADILARNQSKAADLMRDYTVNKNLYEDFLSRKENAELSVAITRDGRGLTYRIVGAPDFPFAPTGLTFKHFLLAAPVLAFGAPIGLLLAFILLDPKVRTVSLVRSTLGSGVHFLGAADHYNTAFYDRILRKDIVVLGGILGLVVVIYVYVGFIGLST